MSWGGEIPALSAINVRADSIDLSRTVHWGSDALYEKWMTQGDPEAGDVVITTEAPMGNVAQLPDDQRYILSQRVILLKPKRDVLDPAFLARQMRSAEFQALLIEHQSGTTATGIRQSRLVTLPIQVPPLNEQRRIVARLDAIFEQTRAAKARLERLPALLEKLKRSILAAAFRGDLTKDWRAGHHDVESADILLAGVRERRRRKNEGSGVRTRNLQDKHSINHQQKALLEEADLQTEGLFEVPPTWRWCRFDEIATSLRGGTATRAENAKTAWPVLRSSAVRHGEIDFDDVRYLRSTEQESDADLVRKGDLLFTRLSGTLNYVGHCAIVRNHPHRATYYPDRIFRAQIDEAISAEFVELAFAVTSLRGALERSAKSSAGHQRISLSDLRDFVLPIPPFEEQEEISKLVNAAIRKIANIRIRIEHAQDLNIRCKQAALAKAFRGDLVPQDPTDESAVVLLDRIRSARLAEAKRPQSGDRDHQGADILMEAGGATVVAVDHASNEHHDEKLDLIVGVLQCDRRLTTTAITDATGLDASAVKKVLKVLVDSGQVRVHGRARATTYEWSP